MLYFLVFLLSVAFDNQDQTRNQTPVGACENMIGECFITSKVRCELTGGVYMGNGVACGSY